MALNKKIKFTCQNCKSHNKGLEYDDLFYDMENNTTSYDHRIICLDCDYDNYIKNNYMELKDGQKVKKI